MKRIIVCADGTWNTPDQKDRNKRKPSNVVKTARAIVPLASDGTHQVVYYHKGIGTHKSLLDRFVGGGFGRGLSVNIINCYRFIAQNYEKGDELFFFGFSRGAYTVRSLAGLIGVVGLLPKENLYYLEEAYNYYRRFKKTNSNQLEDFKKKNSCIDIKIKFIGVWDTVGALGIPKIGWGFFYKLFSKSKLEFHDVQLGLHIEHAYHALAIDERRKPFKPSLWELPPDSSQTLEQVWFAGVHTNIGGGYDNDGLANIPFQWIREKAEEHGLVYNKEYTKYYKPYFNDELRDNMTFVYKLLGKNLRKIGKNKHTNERVHELALKRLELNEDYRSRNLVDFVKG